MAMVTINKIDAQLLVDKTKPNSLQEIPQDNLNWKNIF